MPITDSAKKAVRQNLRRRVKNSDIKEKVKKLEKEIRFAVAKKDIEKAKKNLALFFKAMDKAAKENIVGENKAARKKSRLSKLINSFS